MAYPPRVYVPGVSVHVIRRGNNGCDIVGDDADRRALLRNIESAASRSGVSVHGFVIMTTHYHLLVTPTHEEALPGMMKKVGERYVRYFNRRHDRFGTLWAGRYNAIPILDERYWLTCLRYIEQNPWRAHMVSGPESYRWSSYRAHAYDDGPDWVAAHPVYIALGATPAERQLTYRRLCSVPLSDEDLGCIRHPEPIPALVIV